MDVMAELAKVYALNAELLGGPNPAHDVALLSNMTDLLCQIATLTAAKELQVTFTEEAPEPVHLLFPGGAA